jgi:hypothetical protein
VARDGLGHSTNVFGFRSFIEMALLFGIGDAVPEDFVATCAQFLRDIWTVFIDGRIHLRLDRNVEFVEQLE